MQDRTSIMPAMKIILNFAIMLAGLQPLCSQAMKAVCDVNVQGTQSTVSTTASPSPYTSSAVDYPNGFRFALHLSSEQDELKTYVYYDAKNRYVLLQQNIAKVDPVHCTLPLLKSYVYSPGLERELSYSCKVECTP